MANVCERCKHPMSSHDDHASCPQCRVAAGLCNLDVHDPCSICKVWTPKQWGKLRRSLADARARASQRGREHWTAAFPQLEAWITARPASASSSGPASEISSLVSGGDFGDNLLVSTPNPLVRQDLVDFLGGSGYYTHNTQGYLAKPESLVIPSRPPPAERTAEDQPFFHVPRNPEDPRTRVDISSGSASLTASHLLDQEAKSRKNAAAASTALSLVEYIDNYLGMPEGARAVMLLLKLDIISCLNYAWREAHNKMLLRRSIALDCLRRTLPPIDEDQKLAILHAPFKGTTLFGGELAKLQEANMKRAATFTVFPQPTAPPASFSTRPYVGRGKSFNDRKGFKKPGGRGRGQGRSTPSATSTKPGQSKEGQKSLTVSVSSYSKN